MLQRDAYIRRLLLIKDEKGVNFIHGPKGSGKTMLLNLLFDSLTKIEGADVAICFPSSHPDSVENKKYVLIDDIDEHPELLTTLISNEMTIYATCKSLSAISVVTGRKNILKLYPLSFSEYRSLLCRNLSLKKSYDRYRSNLTLIPLDEVRAMSNFSNFAYFSDTLSSLKNSLREKMSIEREDCDAVLNFISSSIGRILSINDISVRTKVYERDVIEIIKALEEAGIIAAISGYDEEKEELLDNGRKYYLSDNYYIKRLSENLSQSFFFENIIAMELLRREEHVYYGVYSDFITFYEFERRIFQSAVTSEDARTKAESIRKFKGANKYVITEAIDDIDVNGIEFIDAISFLSSSI